MSRVVKKHANVDLRGNLLDRFITAVAPSAGARRMETRMRMELAASFFSGGGYEGASATRRETNTWSPFPSDADSASLYDLSALRSRSRDAERNQPIATGAIGTTCMNVVGNGLKLQSMIDAEVLGLGDNEAAAWQRDTERRWNLWANSKDCDLERTRNFAASLDAILFQRLVNGESFVLLPIVPLKGLSNPLRLQLVEADRVGNPDLQVDRTGLVAGVEKDRYGAPTAYHILRGHPGNLRYLDQSRWEWDRYPAFNTRTGMRNVIHYYRSRRGETRGVPMLAPVLEPLRMLTRYTQAELMAAVVSAMFTVFVKTPTGQGMGNLTPAPGARPVVTQAQDTSQGKPDLQLGNGLILDLMPGEDVAFADPKRPNSGFDPFFLAMVRQIGIAIGIPYEVLIKHYTASYSAARAALLDAWAFFQTMRADLVDNVCAIVYAVWMAQEVAQGTIAAPGFFASPLVRAAWLGAQWNGPAMKQINPKDEVEAAKIRVDEGFTTRAEETAQMNGGDWETKHRQRVKEEQMRKEGGLADVPTQIKKTITQSVDENPDAADAPDKPEAA